MLRTTRDLTDFLQVLRAQEQAITEDKPWQESVYTVDHIKRSTLFSL